MTGDNVTGFNRRATDQHRSRFDRMMDWKGWRVLGALAAAILAGSVLFAAVTLAQHTQALNTQNGYLHCIKQDFNQTLNEAFYHQPLHPAHC